MRKVLIYTGARVGLFAGVMILLYPFAGVSLGTILLAIVLSALLSYVMLGRMRERMVAAWLQRREERLARKSAGDIAEDEEVDRIEEGEARGRGTTKTARQGKSDPSDKNQP